MHSKLVHIDEMVKHFGVTPATVRNWIKNREFPGEKIDGSWRFNWAEVHKWEQTVMNPKFSNNKMDYKDYLNAKTALSLSSESDKDPISTSNLLLINNDCIDALDDIEDNTVDLLLTDPPYNLGLFMQKRSTNLKQLRKNYFGAAGWDNLDAEEWSESMDDFFSQITRVLRKGGSAIIFMAVIKVETLINMAQRHGLYYKTTGTWHKLNPMPRNMNLHFINSTESWLYFVNDAHTGTFNNDGKALHDFFETPIAPKSERLFGSHPTQKPLSLMKNFIEVLSNPGDVVLDPFMGSGSSGVSALALGRNFIGIELNKKYFDIATKRLGVNR